MHVVFVVIPSVLAFGFFLFWLLERYVRVENEKDFVREREQRNVVTTLKAASRSKLDRTKLPPGWEDSWDGPYTGPAAAVEGFGHRVSRGHWDNGGGPPPYNPRPEAEVIAETWAIMDEILAPYLPDASMKGDHDERTAME